MELTYKEVTKEEFDEFLKNHRLVEEFFVPKRYSYCDCLLSKSLRETIVASCSVYDRDYRIATNYDEIKQKLEEAEKERKEAHERELKEYLKVPENRQAYDDLWYGVNLVYNMFFDDEEEED